MARLRSEQYVNMKERKEGYLQEIPHNMERQGCRLQTEIIVGLSIPLEAGFRTKWFEGIAVTKSLTVSGMTTEGGAPRNSSTEDTVSQNKGGSTRYKAFK